tara:strand:- start:184 stop:846 length:663 start_codon:yes stop_codon:yes gene_type:complete
MKIIYHRCNHLEQITTALAYDGFESDVQVSQDGVPVLFHDNVLKNGNRVATVRASDLPGLITVKDFCQALVNAGFQGEAFWELKSDDPRLPKAFGAVIAQFKQLQHIVVSFLPQHLKAMHAIMPSVKLGLIAKDARLPDHPADFPGQCSFYQAPSVGQVEHILPDIELYTLSLEHQLCDEYAAQLPYMLSCYTVNDPQCVPDECDYVITDEPELLKDVLV